jgi:hypothetical protein
MTIKSLERTISKFEGITVKLRHSSGRDVRSDKRVSIRYPFKNKAADSMSVSSWLRNRFDPVCPGYRCDVLDQEKHPAHGRTQLGKLRGSARA